MFPAHISVERLGLHITDATFSYIKRVTLKVFDFDMNPES